MPILIRGSGGGKPKLQEKSYTVKPYKTSLSSWNEYDEITADGNYDGLSKVNVQRLWLRAVNRMLGELTDNEKKELVFSLSSNSEFQNVTVDNLFGIYLYTKEPEKVTDDDLIYGLFLSSHNSIYDDWDTGLSCCFAQNKQIWTPSSAGNFYIKITGSTLTLGKFQNISLSTQAGYCITLLYNKISVH